MAAHSVPAFGSANPSGDAENKRGGGGDDWRTIRRSDSAWLDSPVKDSIERQSQSFRAPGSGRVLEAQ